MYSVFRLNARGGGYTNTRMMINRYRERERERERDVERGRGSNTTTTILSRNLMFPPRREAANLLYFSQLVQLYYLHHHYRRRRRTVRKLVFYLTKEKITKSKKRNLKISFTITTKSNINTKTHISISCYYSTVQYIQEIINFFNE